MLTWWLPGCKGFSQNMSGVLFMGHIETAET